jgi:hypothetical protein
VTELGAQDVPLGGIQPLPEIKRDDSGKMYSDSAAAVAIAGMADSELVRRLVRLEGCYQALTDTFESRVAWEPNMFARRNTVIRKLVAIREIHGEVVDAIRAQVAELALAHQALLSEVNQAGIRQSFMLEHDRMAADLRSLRQFLKERFGSDMEKAELLNTPLLEVAKQIMLRDR